MSVATPEAIGYYTPRDVARLAGVSPLRIGRWAREGIILPSVSTHPNVYSYADAGEAILAHYLVREGKRPREIKGIVLALRRDHGTVAIGDRARLRTTARCCSSSMSTAAYGCPSTRPDHEVLGGTLINLRRIREALGRGGWVAIDSPP